MGEGYGGLLWSFGLERNLWYVEMIETYQRRWMGEQMGGWWQHFIVAMSSISVSGPAFIHSTVPKGAIPVRLTESEQQALL